MEKEFLENFLIAHIERYFNEIRKEYFTIEIEEFFEGAEQYKIFDAGQYTYFNIMCVYSYTLHKVEIIISQPKLTNS